MLVSGFCLDNTTDRGRIVCQLDGGRVLGRFIDSNTALCVTPSMRTSGEVPMSLVLRGRRNRPSVSAKFTTGRVETLNAIFK